MSTRFTPTSAEQYAMADRVYHGVQHDPGPEGWQSARIEVEQAEYGPTERRHVLVLRELETLGGFGWGYNGTGTSMAAAAILADALHEPVDRFLSENQERTLLELREAFCADFLAHQCDEFRIRRGAILRWVRGWYTQMQIDDLPALASAPPPVEDLEYPRIKR